MQVPKSIAILAALAIAGAALAQIERPVRLGEPLPPLELNYIKGKSIAPPNGRNITLIEFWATWCKPCLRTIPHLTALQERYREQGLQVVGVSDEDAEKVLAFVQRMGNKMNYNVAVDVHNKTTNRFRESNGPIPRAYLFNQEGLLIWIGHPADPKLEQLIEELSDELEAES